MTTLQLSAVTRTDTGLLPTDEIVRRFTDVNGRPARSTSARKDAMSTVLVGCPGPSHARGDRNPSLSVSAMPDGSTRLHCFAGCESDEVLASIGLTWRSIRPLRTAVIRPTSPTLTAPRSVERRRAADVIAGLVTVQSFAAHDAARTFITGRGWNHMVIAELGGRVVPIAGRACLVFDGAHGGRALDGADPKVIVPAGTCRHPWVVDRGTRPSLLVIVEGLSDLVGAAHLSWGQPVRLLSMPSAGTRLPDLTERLDGIRSVVIAVDADAPGRRLSLNLCEALVTSGVDVVDLCPPSAVKDLDGWRQADSSALDCAIQAATEGLALPGDTSTGWVEVKCSARPERAAPGQMVSDVEMTEVDWLWPSWIPIGFATVLAGRGGIGKGVLVADLLTRVTRGTSWPDGTHSRHGGALIIAGAGEDDAAHAWAPRHVAAGADIRRVRVVEHVDGRPPALPDHLTQLTGALAALRERIGEHEPVLVVVDSLAGCSSADIVKSHEARSVLGPLGDWAKTNQVAMLIVAHSNKIRPGTGGQASDQISGSTAVVDAARSAIVLAHHADDMDLGEDERRRVVAPVKANLSRRASGFLVTIGQGAARLPDGRVIGAPVLRWGERVEVADRAVMASDGPLESDRNDAEAWTREALAGGPRPAAEILAFLVSEFGIPRRTAQRLRERIGAIIEFEPGAQPPKRLWRLTPEAPRGATENM